jgi:hypothetical protein
LTKTAKARLLNARRFKNRPQIKFSRVPKTVTPFENQSCHGIQMVINWTKIFVRFSMLFYHSFSGSVFKSSTKLEHLVQKNVFDFLHIKNGLG